MTSNKSTMNELPFSNRRPARIGNATNNRRPNRNGDGSFGSSTFRASGNLGGRNVSIED